MALKELEVRYASKRTTDYKLADGEGLHLLVRPNGSKLWHLKYRFAGKEKLLSFGAYPETSLSDARPRRAEAKLVLAEGLDPGAKAATSAAITFEAAARAWHKNPAASLDKGHADRILVRDVLPAFGKKSMRAVTSADGPSLQWTPLLSSIGHGGVQWRRRGGSFLPNSNERRLPCWRAAAGR